MNIVVLLPWITLSALLISPLVVSPEPTCDAHHTEILILADLRHDTNLTITRFKNIVSYFITKVKDDIIKTLDVCLVDPFQRKTLLNLTKVNSLREIMFVFDQLVMSNESCHDYDESLDYKTELSLAFEYSLELFSNDTADDIEDKKHVVVLLSNCHGSSKEIEMIVDLKVYDNTVRSWFTVLELSSKIDTKIFNEKNLDMYDYKEINMVYIDSKDDFYFYNPVILDLCKDCPRGWTRNTGSENRLSCYRIYRISYPVDTAISWFYASSFCESVKSSLPAIETEDELTFLIELLNKRSAIRTADLNVTGTATTAVINVGLLKRCGLRQHHYMWTNLRPFNLEARFDSTDDSRDRCVAFSFPINALYRRDKIQWKNVNCDEPISKILVCEMEGRLIHDYNKMMDKIKITAQSSQKRKLNVKSRMSVRQLSGTRMLSWGMFHCQDDNNKVVTYSKVCDGSRNCNNGRDEQYCHTISSIEKQSEYLCVNPNGVGDYPTRASIPLEARCNMIQDCPDNSDEQGCDGCLGKQCHDRTCLPGHWLSRDHDACHKNVTTNGTVYLNMSYPCKGNCSGLDQFNHEISFCNKNMKLGEYQLYKNISSGLEWSPKCLYLRGSDGSPTGCPNKYHLRGCSTFHCPEGFLKCPDSYCVPVYNFRDGILDCPYGEDEVTSFETFSNIGYIFRCLKSFKKSINLIHLVNICDGVPQCPYGEDESYCKVTCPRGFKCNGQAVEVDNHTLVPEIISLNIFDIQTKFLNLSGIDLSKLKEIFIFPNLLEIHATNCNIKDLGKIFVIEYEILYLYTANLSYNNLKVLFNFGPLSRLYNLQFLNLSHNKNLSEIGVYSILSTKLHTLDLSFTGISFLNLHILDYNNAIKYLNLYKTKLVKFDLRKNSVTFEFLNLDKTELSEEEMKNILKLVSVSTALYVDHYRYCCPQFLNVGTHKHACRAPPEAISSCEDLLGDILKRSLLWLVAVVSLAGNIVVITYRLVFDRGVIKKGYGIFVTNLSVSDFIMGVYLLIIASTDVRYRDEYVFKESVWRHSALCQAAGFLSTLSSETSTFFVILITLDRFLVIKFPFGDHRFTKLSLVLSVLTSWILGFILASIPLIYPEWIMYSSNGMCFGLPLSFDPHLVWHYSFGVFICFNFILFLCIAYGQVFIFRLISSSQSFQMTDAMSVARRIQDINVAKQLFFVVLSNFLCWFPICVLGFLSLTGYNVSPDTYAWLVVFVMPLNAAVNPMIYTIPFMYSKWQNFKKGEITRTRRRVKK